MPELRDFLLPDLGEGLTEGEILTWLVAVDDVVTVDQPIAEIGTEKAVVQVPTPFAGRVAVLHGAPGDVVAVGRPLISIEVAAESVTSFDSGNVLVGYGTNEGPTQRRRRVTRADLERAQAQATSAQPSDGADGNAGGTRSRLTGADRVAAERLTRSYRDIPTATAWAQADATQLLELRTELSAKHSEVHLTPFALLLRLCVRALSRFPRLNAHFDADANEIISFNPVHLGVAVQTDRGLVVPVIRDAATLPLPRIAAELERLAGAARDGSIEAAELRGSTFTVSNFGAFGVDGGTALINPPEVAILGVGQIAQRPWIAGGQVTARSVVELSLVFDHRVADGAVAGGFVRHLADLIEQPRQAMNDD
jgi:2-oxoisovalerate dehydrogenase E2 component (dihydrolipoyl transacylase)